MSSETPNDNRSSRQVYLDLLGQSASKQQAMVAALSLYPQSQRPPTTVPYAPAGLVIHNRDMCDGRPCTFHNPSDHHMKTWPINVRLDKMTLAERVCKHHIGHPDPDSLSWLAINVFSDKRDAQAMGVHGCDGCCAKPIEVSQ